MPRAVKFKGSLCIDGDPPFTEDEMRPLRLSFIFDIFQNGVYGFCGGMGFNKQVLQCDSPWLHSMQFGISHSEKMNGGYCRIFGGSESTV